MAAANALGKATERNARPAPEVTVTTNNYPILHVQAYAAETAKMDFMTGWNPRRLSEHVVSRRRRTGCLTCRRRHVKCKEERPTCNRCRAANYYCKGMRHLIKYLMLRAKHHR
jgi:hypothetical protein